MKTLLISGMTLALLTGGAFAQATAQPPAPPAAGAAAPPPPPPRADGVAGARPPAPPAPGAAAPPPPGGPDAEADDADGPPPPPGPGPRGRRPPPPPPSKAAHFRLQRGDAMVEVKCADDEPMKLCADLALQMVDRLQAMARP
jgi:hypothetical protein